MFHSLKLVCLGLIGKGQLDVHYPFKKLFCYNFSHFHRVSPLHFTLNISMSVFSPQISAEYPSAWVASSHSSWECVIGLSTSFFFLVCFDSFLSLGLCIDQQRAKSGGCCFCCQCTQPEVLRISFSLLISVCTCCLTCQK